MYAGESECATWVAYDVNETFGAATVGETQSTSESGNTTHMYAGESECATWVAYEDVDENFSAATVGETQSTSESIIPVNTTDNHDGTYSLFFTPTSMGDHQLNVEIFGCRIKGSPFQVKVSSECEEIQALMSKHLTKGEKRQVENKPCTMKTAIHDMLLAVATTAWPASSKILRILLGILLHCKEM